MQSQRAQSSSGAVRLLARGGLGTGALSWPPVTDNHCQLPIQGNGALATVHDASQNSKFRVSPTGFPSFPSLPPDLILLGILARCQLSY